MFFFLGRKQSVDMVGEKMSTDAARQVIQNVAVKHNLEPVTLLALASEKMANPPIWLSLVQVKIQLCSYDGRQPCA